MPTYYYRAITQNGVIVRNKVEDINRLNLMRKLKKNGLMPITVIQTTKKRISKIKEKRHTSNGMSDIMKSATTQRVVRSQTENKKGIIAKYRAFMATSRGVKLKDILVFTQNFYLLKKANFNNIQAFSTIIENTENEVLKEILADILAGVEAGESIYSTMEYYDGVFPYIYISMIKSGELSGALTDTLKQAIDYLEDTIDMNKKLKTILLPNIVQFVSILILLVAGTLIAIPMIQDVYDSVGTTQQLPEITRWFSGVLDGFLQIWPIFVIIILGIVGTIIWYINTPKGRYKFDYFKYTMPIFGRLIYSIDFLRFINGVSLNVKNGIRIQDALETGKNTVRNLVLLSVIETSINNILIGRSWIEPFEQTNFSSTMATEMLKIGMQTDISMMLDKIVEYMKQDIDESMKKAMKALPQVVYSIVGVTLIFFVLVVLVPMIQVYFGTFLFDATNY